jgi:hypothetical protein
MSTGEWISVKDRLPDNKDDVLIFDGDRYWIGWYSQHNELFNIYGDQLIGEFWMPLPPKPEN